MQVHMEVRCGDSGKASGLTVARESGGTGWHGITLALFRLCIDVM